MTDEISRIDRSRYQYPEVGSAVPLRIQAAEITRRPLSVVVTLPDGSKVVREKEIDFLVVTTVRTADDLQLTPYVNSFPLHDTPVPVRRPVDGREIQVRTWGSDLLKAAGVFDTGERDLSPDLIPGILRSLVGKEVSGEVMEPRLTSEDDHGVKVQKLVSRVWNHFAPPVTA